MTFLRFCFNDTATTEFYTLSLHAALPIWQRPTFYTARCSLRQRPWFLYCPFLVAAAPHFIYCPVSRCGSAPASFTAHFSLRQHPRFLYCPFLVAAAPDRKSTRLNSSHTVISYAVFCLKKKTQKKHKNPYKKETSALPTPTPHYSHHE